MQIDDYVTQVNFVVFASMSINHNKTSKCGLIFVEQIDLICSNDIIRQWRIPNLLWRIYIFNQSTHWVTVTSA